MSNLPWPTDDQIEELTDRVWKSNNIAATGDVKSTGHLRQYAMALGLAMIESRGACKQHVEQALNGGAAF